MANQVDIQVRVDGARRAQADLGKISESTNQMSAQFGAASTSMAAMSGELSGSMGMVSGSIAAVAMGIDGIKTASDAGKLSMMSLLGPIGLIATAVAGAVYSFKLMYDAMSGATEEAEKLKESVDSLTASFDEFLSKSIRLTRKELEDLTRAEAAYNLSKAALTEAQEESIKATQKEIELQSRLKTQLADLAKLEREYQSERDVAQANQYTSALSAGYNSTSQAVLATSAATHQLNKEIAQTRKELESLRGDTSLDALASSAIEAADRLEKMRAEIMRRGKDARDKEADEDKKRLEALAAKRRSAWLKMLADEEALAVQREALRVSQIEDEEQKALAALQLANEQRLKAIDKTTAREREKEKSRWAVIESGLHEELKIREQFEQRRLDAEQANVKRLADAYRADLAARIAAANQLAAIDQQIQTNADAQLSVFESRLAALSEGVSGQLAIMSSSTMQAAEQMKSALDGLDSLLAGVGEGFAASAVDALMAGQSFAVMLKELASSTAREAMISGLMESAKGVARLAVGDLAGSAAHFKAAGIFAAVGGVAAGISGAMGGGSSGASAAAVAPSAREIDRSTFDREQRESGPTVINVNFAGDVYDSEYAASQALAARVTRAINDRGRGRPILRAQRV